MCRCRYCDTACWAEYRSKTRDRASRHCRNRAWQHLEFRRWVAEACLLRDVFKCAVAAIVPETNGSSFVGFRSAVRFAFAVEGAIQVGFRRPLDIIADDQVDMAVFVVVNPGGAGAEFLRTEQTCFLRDIREGAVAIVAKKVALAVRSDEKIVVTVVVVVPHGHAHPEQLDVKSSFVCHVGEGAVMIVAIELGSGVLLNVAGPVHAIDKKNVRPAIVVVVNESHTRAHGFWQEFLPEGAIVMNEVDSGGLRDVAELNR